MRILVFFDLPMETAEDKRSYSRFRKALLKNGFFMMQESVYCRMVLNQTVGKRVIDTIRKVKPNAGLVQVLSVTEKQFSKMEFMVGSDEKEEIDSDERLIIL